MATIRILNLGAGVQSTTLYLMGGWDFAIFADTGDESAEVYRHLDWLEANGSTPIIRTSIGRLGDDLIAGRNSTGHKFVAIPAFTPGRNGRTGGILRHQCSREYKRKPILEAIRRQVLGLRKRFRATTLGVHVVQGFGISCDEGGRASRMQRSWKLNRNWNLKWCEPVFPLIEMGMTRTDCLKWLAGRVPHRVPRSMCVFCPYQTRDEWRYRRDHDPAGWARALEIDAALRRNGTSQSSEAYLHPSCRPLSESPMDSAGQDAGWLFPAFNLECQGVCGM